MRQKQQRGAKYSVEFIANELGVDKSTLHRRLNEAHVNANGAGITFQEAYAALTTHRQREESRALKEKIDVETAQIEHAKAKEELALMKDVEFMVVDLARQGRTIIENAAYIPKDARKRLAREMGAVRVERPRPAK